MDGNLRDLFSYYCSLMQQHPEKDAFRLEKKQDLYGFFKQATVGDAPKTGPSFLQPKALTKWNAWNNMRGMSQQDAMSGYILTAKTLENYVFGK